MKNELEKKFIVTPITGRSIHLHVKKTKVCVDYRQHPQDRDTLAGREISKPIKLSKRKPPRERKFVTLLVVYARERIFIGISI